MLVCSELNAAYGSVPCLRNVSLTVMSGTVLALAGANASGKSTLARCLCGAQDAQSGSIGVDGEAADAALLRASVGLVSQDADRQLFAKTAFDDVAFGLRNGGLPEDEVEKRVRRALACVNLDADTARDRSPQDYSGGQRRRLAIAGILVLNRRYMLFDEADAGLDPHERSSLADLVRNLAHSGTGVLVISHDLEFVGRVADDVALLGGGRIVARGPKRQIMGDLALLERAGLRAAPLASIAIRLAALGVEGLDPCAPPHALAAQIARAWRERS